MQKTESAAKTSFTGTGRGLMGDIKVEVGFSIDSIKIIQEEETVGIGDLALRSIPDRIVEANSLDVDAITSATITTDGIKNAVKDALYQAVEEITGEALMAEEAGPKSAVAGEIIGTGAGLHGPVVVRVESSDGNTIENVEVIEHSETPGIGTKAIDELPAIIVQNNNYDVDHISGATVTSNAIKEGVKEAMETGGGTSEQFLVSAIGSNGPIMLSFETTDGKSIQDIQIVNEQVEFNISKKVEETDSVSAASVKAEEVKVEETDSVSAASVKAEEEEVEEVVEEVDSISSPSKAVIEAVLSTFETGENEYLGQGDGMNGSLVVRITTADGTKIDDVTVLEHHETEGIGTLAIDALPKQIVKKQSLELDSISGASVTSRAILDGTKEALEKAKSSN